MTYRGERLDSYRVRIILISGGFGRVVSCLYQTWLWKGFVSFCIMAYRVECVPGCVSCTYQARITQCGGGGPYHDRIGSYLLARIRGPKVFVIQCDTK